MVAVVALTFYIAVTDLLEPNEGQDGEDTVNENEDGNEENELDDNNEDENIGGEYEEGRVVEEVVEVKGKENEEIEPDANVEGTNFTLSVFWFSRTKMEKNRRCRFGKTCEMAFLFLYKLCLLKAVCKFQIFCVKVLFNHCSQKWPSKI